MAENQVSANELNVAELMLQLDSLMISLDDLHCGDTYQFPEEDELEEEVT
jgi:hypothetical protein